jgi:plastocyanin
MAAAAVVLAGCGGGEQKKPARSVTVPPGGTVEVTADEYAFDPGRIVVAPGDVTITLRNKGSLPHDFRVEQGQAALGGTSVVPGGKTATAKVTLETGSYEFFCSVGDHARLGMRGDLEVG